MRFFENLSDQLNNIITRKVDAQLFRWVNAVSKWLDGGSTFPDLNTLVPGNVGLSNWTGTPAAIDAWVTLDNAGEVYGPVGTAASAVLVNGGGVAGGVSEGSCAFPTFSGLQAVDISIRAALPTGIVSSTLYFEVRDTAGNLITSGTQALAAAMATYTIFSNVLVTYPTEYFINVFCNQAPSSVQAQAIIEWVKVTPTTFTAGTWRDDLYRIELGPAELQGGYDLFARGRYWARQAYTATYFRTDAPIFYFQQFCNNAGVGNGCSVRINGSQDGTVFNSTGNSVTPVWDLVSVALDRDLSNLVELDCGLNNQGPGPTGSVPGNVVGTFPTAIYFPKGHRFDILERVNAREVFTMYGDSIVSGIGVPFPELNGIEQNLRKLIPYDMVCESVGARSLVGDIIFNGSVLAVAKLITKNRPKVLWIQVGTNDYGGLGGGTAAVATWGADMVALCQACVALIPDITIFVQTITDRLYNGVNGFGDTVASYQAAAIAAVATVGLPNVLSVDASLWISVGGQTSDGLHYNQFGQSIYIQRVRNTLIGSGFA